MSNIRKKILVLCSVGKQGAAIRYRILDTLKVLENQEKVTFEFIGVYSDRTMRFMDGNNDVIKIVSLLIDIGIFISKIIRATMFGNYNTILVKNCIWPMGHSFSEQLVYRLFWKKRWVYDIDDAIYFNLSRQRNIFNILRRNDQKVGYWLKKADCIIISNDVIYNDLQHMYGLDKGKCVFYLSAPFQKQYFDSSNCVALAKKKSEVRIIWLGSPFTQDNLQIVKEFIEQVPQYIPNAHIILMGCSKQFNLFRSLSHVEFVEWSEENEKQEMCLAHFGLNPLINDKFQKRKSAFKVIQYYRAGIMPIVSDVGINKALIQKYGGYCSSDFRDTKDIAHFMNISLLEYNAESVQMYNKTQELSVEENAKKLLSVL